MTRAAGHPATLRSVIHAKTVSFRPTSGLCRDKAILSFTSRVQKISDHIFERAVFIRN